MLHVHYTRPGRLRDFNRSVGRAVVGDDDFAMNSCVFESGDCLLYTSAYSFALVQTRQDDRKLECLCCVGTCRA
jgi:hypothetical protein